jgi:HAD superfamily hydrolase (TIGR01549 family)
MALDLQRVKALCFDVDGTLSDTDDAWAHRLALLLGSLRFIFPSRQTLPFARWLVMTAETPGNLAYHLLDRLDLDDNLSRWLERAARRQDVKPRHFWLVPKVDQALKRLAGQYPMSVVSARGATGTQAFLTQFGLEGYFQAVATSQTCRRTKPFPDPVLWAADQMKVSPHNCLMIGDTTVDIRAGKLAGAQTVGVLCGFGTAAELLRSGADLILPSPYELLELMGL